MTRVSLGAQSFRPHLLRRPRAAGAARAGRGRGRLLRDGGRRKPQPRLDVWGSGAGGGRPSSRPRGCARARAGPRQLLRARGQARHALHRTATARELERQAEAMEDYYETVVATLRGAGYRWYETANFCRPGHECRHNLGYWLGHDYLGVGRRRGLDARPRAAPEPARPARLPGGCRGRRPSRPPSVEQLTPSERGTERLMLGLRLDRPLRAERARRARRRRGLRPAGGGRACSAARATRWC